MHELARASALVAVGRLRRVQGRETAEPAAPEDGADGRERHREHGGDLGRGHAQLPEGDDCRHAVGRRTVRDAPPRGGAVAEAAFSLATPGANTTWQAVRALLPAASAAGDGPAVQLDPLDEEPAATRVGAGVAVEPLR